MDITDYRKQIDEIDRELLAKLDERMRVAEKIAEYKREKGLRVSDPVRERQLLDKITDISKDDMVYYSRMMFNLIIEMSCDHQRKTLGNETELVGKIRTALENTEKFLPDRAAVACQGVQGAYSQEACDKMFRMPKITYMTNFRGVFDAIDRGVCRYGVLPIENSTAGSVNQVYDLMREYNFYIVKSIKVKIRHCLLVNPGTSKEDIKEIFSHEQAIAQCEDYLRQFPMAKITICENTAAAAKILSESGRTDAAAIASSASAEAYGLDCFESGVQDKDNNYTRFICITKNLEIFPGANKTSIMLVVNHTPGSLYRVLARFNAMSINISKLESRPIPEREFEFMFYFDIEESVYSEAFALMISQLQEMSAEFKYLGSYPEV